MKGITCQREKKPGQIDTFTWGGESRKKKKKSFEPVTNLCPTSITDCCGDRNSDIVARKGVGLLLGFVLCLVLGD